MGWKLLKELLAFGRSCVIPLDAALVKGSHGRADTPPRHSPVFLSSEPELVPEGAIDARHVKDLVLAHVFDAAT